MKRWTRKFLAGLLSFGMLLQVAKSPQRTGGGRQHTGWNAEHIMCR